MKNNNMERWDKLKNVPIEVKKKITGGRLKGMTDIKPQWRLQILTEIYGSIGFGWKFEVTKQWIEEGSNNQKVAFTNINLFVKVDDVWSDAIFGTGGSSFIAKETSGLHTSDECYKMSLTDAVSVAAKSLGVASDVYMGLSDSKYEAAKPKAKEETDNRSWLSEKQLSVIISRIEKGEVKLKQDTQTHFKMIPEQLKKLQES